MPELTAAHTCGRATCSTLKVPLDRSRQGGETLELRVAVEGERQSAGVRLPQRRPGRARACRSSRARASGSGRRPKDVRLVAIDQRGTGEDALDCPGAAGADGRVGPHAADREAVADCATKLGDRRALLHDHGHRRGPRSAAASRCGADKLALDGISYGTYVAQRYALAHPRRVSGLVLDSVVPAEGVEPAVRGPIKATARVLGQETTKALAKVVARRAQRPGDARHAHGAVGRRAARRRLHGRDPPGRGRRRRLAEALARAACAKVVHRWTAKKLSQGLHASTLCADTPAPWGDASAPLGGPQAGAEAAADKLSDADLYPYDRETATGNGFALQCLYWPPVAVPEPAGPRDLPDVPTLLLAGDHDLSTPLRVGAAAAEHAPERPADRRQGRRPRRPGQGDPKALAAVRRLVASPRVIRPYRRPDPHPPHAQGVRPRPRAARRPARAVRARALGAEPPPDRPVALPRARPERARERSSGRRGREAGLGRQARPRAHADRRQRQADRRRRAGPRGRARDRRRRLHRPAGRARPRRSPATGARCPCWRPGGRAASDCPTTSCRSACCTSATRARSSASPSARPVEEIAFFLD